MKRSSRHILFFIFIRLALCHFKVMIHVQESRIFHGTRASNFPYLGASRSLSPWQTAGGLVVTNSCLVLLFCVLAALPAFSAQHVAVHPRPGFETGEQETIRQIVDMERQAKEASLRRDADFSIR